MPSPPSLSSPWFADAAALREISIGVSRTYWLGWVCGGNDPRKLPVVRLLKQLSQLHDAQLLLFCHEQVSRRRAQDTRKQLLCALAVLVTAAIANLPASATAAAPPKPPKPPCANPKPPKCNKKPPPFAPSPPPVRMLGLLL